MTDFDSELKLRIEKMKYLLRQEMVLPDGLKSAQYIADLTQQIEACKNSLDIIKV